MFDEQPQLEIDALIKANPEFKQLFQRHRDLDKKVMDAELGVLPIDDVTLHQMKREKLAAKDRLIQLYDKRAHCRPAAGGGGFLVGRRRRPHHRHRHGGRKSARRGGTPAHALSPTPAPAFCADSR